jgi:hypothetical protein
MIFQICKKRGPLGACLESVVRTESNDNDKAKQYFRDPSEIVRQKEATLRAAAEETQGNALIEKLRQQTEDNKEKNRLTVERKTFENDQVCLVLAFRICVVSHAGKTTFANHFFWASRNDATNPFFKKMRAVGLIRTFRSASCDYEYGWSNVYSFRKPASHATKESRLY